MKCVSTDTIAGQSIRHGDIVHSCAVSGANVVRDVREAITNVVGGKMSRYETVLDLTIERAFDTLRSRAAEQGYDGIVGVRVSHPHITDGAIEVVVTGTGFWYEQNAVG
ncbi:MAG: YbjQ family protein [Hyphomicrobiaceae bacterium]